MKTPSATAPWTEADKDRWFKQQSVKRSYKDEVISRIQNLKSAFHVVHYGALTLNPERYPLFLVISSKFDPKKKTALITGGVHGYETSGVHGALAFMSGEAMSYADRFNFVCAPCISPWGYETINRWNPKAIDPNRSFTPDSRAEECAFLIKALSPFMNDIYAHFDLHETTDTDNTVFRPALAARDGYSEEITPIPDGFYTVGDTDNPCPEFQKAIIDSVRKVTHIALPDQQGRLIGEPLQQEGVINYRIKKLSLCAGISSAKYTTTTEVYPDSPKASDAICVQAQVAAIKGGLEYLDNG
jgi:hypothetical protein